MRRVHLAGILCLGLGALTFVGCSRPYWRQNADAEAYGLIREKSQLDARWAPPRTDIIPSPLSRLYDPADPDYGVLPPDDPYAHRYMERMSDCDRIQGSHYWDKIGMGNSIENPAWVASLPIEGAPGPLLAKAFDQHGPGKKSGDESLPFLDRFAVVESWRSMKSMKLPSIFSTHDVAAPGVATVATADVPSFQPTRTATAPAKTAASKAASKGTIELASYQEPTDPFDDARRSPPRLQPGQEPAPLAEPGETPRVDDDPIKEIPDPSDVEPVLPGTPDSLEKPDEDGEDVEIAPYEGVNLAAANPALPEVTDLKLEEALRLSYLHGREYQFQLENVFLAALDLAFDRFQFDVRFLGIGGGRPSSSLNYSATPGGTESLTATNRIGISRLLPAGGQWAVELTNNTLWLFSDSPNESGTASTLGFSFIQPLLFAAGRKVVLEDLTQSERNLLYATRELARFRQEFFVATTTGYLNLLLRIQAIANQEDNIRRLEEQLEIVLADETSDALTQTQLENRRLQQLQSLRNNRRGLQDQLDQYKIQLGLPPDVAMTLNTELLTPFQLISSELVALETAIGEEFLAVWTLLNPEDPSLEGLQEAVGVLADLEERVTEQGIAGVERDFERVDEILSERLAKLPNPDDRERVLENIANDKDQFAQLRQEFQEKVVVPTEVLVSAVDDADTLEERLQIYRDSRGAQEDLERIALSLQGIQIGLRTELIELNPFEMPLVEAVGYALTNRVDLMNERALVMDARRKVEVAANALRAVLDLRVQGDIETRPIFNNDNPLDFRANNSNYRVGLGFVAPLDQIAQRNSYRVSQITYQRVRRNYMLAEDQVKFQVRQDWREIEVLKENFEVARNAIRIAALQYDQAVEATVDPAPQSGRGAGQLGLNLIQALDSVLQAQNSFIGIWVDYESARLNIYRDMGIMDVDARGLWVDPFYQNGLVLPDEDVVGPPGWSDPTSRNGGSSGDKGGLPPIPPAPVPPAGVQREGDLLSRRDGASKSKPRQVESLSGRDIRSAAHTTPPRTSLRETGNERKLQPPVSGRRTQPSDRAGADAQTSPKPAKWRAAAAAK